VTATSLYPDAGTCRVFGEGDELYSAMLADLASAESSVRLESYILAGDEVGWTFAASLAERARAGVRVRVHVDSAGAFLEGTEKVFRFLQSAGVEARWFNRWQWRDPLRYNRRNHRKLLIVDEASMYIGGFNIHRESSYAQVGSGRWRDAHVRVTGPVTRQAVDLFDTVWSGGTAPAVRPWADGFRLIPNESGSCRRVLRCVVIDALSSARRSVSLATPYFVPDRGVRDALSRAVERGVDVRVLLSRETDQRLTRWAGHAMARLLARRGVAFFEYLPRMLHSKLIVVDDSWACVGSANIDYRSYFVNKELSLVTDHLPACESLNGLLMDDFAESRPLAFAERPGSPRSAVAETVAIRLRRWL